MTNFLRLCIVALLCGLAAFPATAQNKTDKNGKKQGEWVKKYPNGNTMYEGSFKDDEPVGTFKRYYENGMLKSVQVYETGDISSVKLYSQDSKTVIAEGNFRGKAKHGMWKLYKDGKLLTEEVYKDDNLQRRKRYRGDSLQRRENRRSAPLLFAKRKTLF